jgi:hypothetical protein
MFKGLKLLFKAVLQDPNGGGGITNMKLKAAAFYSNVRSMSENVLKEMQISLIDDEVYM